jgi:hypothetical protein
LVVVALLGACTPGVSATPQPQAPPTTVAPSPTAPSSGTTAPMTAPTGIPATHWAALLSDLATRGIATEGIEVVTARSVTWPNGALGCPKPGMAYTQMIIDGYQVVVTVGGKTYDYRFGGTATPRLCEL